MGFWGSKKERSRACIGLLDESNAAYSIGTASVIAASDYKCKFMDAYLELAQKSLYTKLVNAQKWAKKHFPWGLLDSNNHTEYTVNKPLLQAYLQQENPIEIVTASVGSADPLMLGLNEIISQYPQYDPATKSITIDDVVYTFNGATTTGDTISIEFYADDEHNIIINATGNYRGTYLYVAYTELEETKYFIQDITNNVPPYVTAKNKSYSSDYFFIVPFRLHEQRLKKLSHDNPNEFLNLYNKSKQLIKKLGYNLELIDSRLHDFKDKPKKDDGSTQGELGKMDEGYIYFGVPISGSAIEINEYIFKYCLYLHKINSTKVVMGSYTWNDGIHLQDYLSGVNVDWSDVIIDYINHNGKPNTYYKESSGDDFIIMKQLTKTRAKRITVKSFTITDIICNEYCTTHYVSDALHHTETRDELFLIPLCKSVLMDMGFSRRNQVCLHGLRVVLDYHEKKSKSFSESKIFKMVVMSLYAPIFFSVAPITTSVGYSQGMFQLLTNKNPTGLAKTLMRLSFKIHNIATKVNNIVMIPVKTLFKVLGPKLGLIVLIIIIIIVTILTFGAGTAPAISATTTATATGTATTAATATATVAANTAASTAAMTSLEAAAAVGTTAGTAASTAWSSWMATAVISVAKQGYDQALNDDLVKRNKKYMNALAGLKQQYENAYQESLTDNLYNFNVSYYTGKNLVIASMRNNLLVSPQYYEHLIDADSLTQDSQSLLDNIINPYNMDQILNKALEMVTV